MANRFALKNATLTFGTATFDTATIIVLPPQTREAVDVTANSDDVHQYIKGALKDNDEITLTIYQKSSGNITVDDAPAALAVAGTLEDGVTTPDPTINLNIPRAIVTKVSPPYIEATGDRKAVYDVTFRPDGSTAAAQTTQGNT
ncbi:MAG: hypothetical protein II265_07620 [Clostridia bacterium]|nr:hypothetical protein [Clostridia bacterium]